MVEVGTLELGEPRPENEELVTGYDTRWVEL
jgi:hypothetical protein